ncbi:integrase core domain-containing protein [Sphingobacterium sp. HJSM2_6]|uniref:integrase core domain-containing protein n=1 Tax=Sphingobacterium sp. HJSM2_6 TaxID=3366264 RepID=UPI003BD2EB98
MKNKNIINYLCFAKALEIIENCLSTSVFFYQTKGKDDSDTLTSSKTIRTLNIIDDFNREVLSISVETSLPASLVIKELEKLVECGGKNGVQWEFKQLGKWTRNSLIERFNRTFSQDVLDSYMFDHLSEIRKYAINM